MWSSGLWHSLRGGYQRLEGTGYLCLQCLNMFGKELTDICFKEGSHSDPWEGLRKWTLIWANGNGRYENSPFQGHTKSLTIGGKWNCEKKYPF
jgi:hypothetical protein